MIDQLQNLGEKFTDYKRQGHNNQEANPIHCYPLYPHPYPQWVVDK